MEINLPPKPIRPSTGRFKPFIGPIRTCVWCQTKRPKTELIRLTLEAGLDKSRELCQKSPRAKVKVRGQARAKLGRQVKLKAKLNERPWARGLKVVFDPSRSARGRGAWICADSPNCLAKALAKGKLARALRAKEPDLSELVLSEGRKFHRNGCQRDG